MAGNNLKSRYRFVNINGGGWWLRIDDCDTLCEYIKDTFGVRKGKVFEDFIFHYDSEDGTLSHAEYEETQGVLMYARRLNSSFPEALNLLYQEVGLNMLHKIQDNGKIWVNSKGGYNAVFDDDMETQTVYRTELVFPEYKREDIRIKQFPGGKHWYAYIGDLQVKGDSGQTVKWNTYEEAYKQAESVIAGKSVGGSVSR